MKAWGNGFRVIRWVIPAIILFSVHAGQAVNGDFRGLEERLVSLYNEHHSAMVRVKAVYPPEEEAEDEVPQVVIGSGFFISREGLIITNASIVYNPLRVWVEHEQIAYSAEVIGMDERSNIAFLRTHRLPKNFNFFHLADRSDLPPVGSFLIRLSMPLEFGASPNFGMVSGYESRFGERFFPCTYVRTTIPAGPGDGGSAYVDLTGRLIGIQVGSLPDIASSYILPARAALRIRDDLLFSGSVTYGWIGFEVELVSGVEIGRKIVLSEVFEDSPAAQAGLMEGDVLKQIGEYPIQTLDTLRNAMFYTRVGQYVDVRVEREDEERRFSVQVGARPEDEPMQIYDPAETNPIEHPLKESVEGEDRGALPFADDFERRAAQPPEAAPPIPPESGEPSEGP
jgi:serine protease Do